MLRKSDIILLAEEAFARRFALGFIVKRPVKPWLQMIPGMFIFDFLKRNKEIKRFSQYYLFLRKVAMGEALEETDKLGDEKIRAWLGSADLDTPAIVHSHIGVLAVLIKHYKRLLRADGETFNELIRNAYDSLEGYKGYLNELTASEKDLDQAIAETVGENSEVRQRLLAEQLQAQEQRNKEIDTIF